MTRKMAENIENKLYWKDGNPKLIVNPLEGKYSRRIAVNTPTRKKYNLLMQVCESGDWEWFSGRKATERKYSRKFYGWNTCISVDELNGKKILGINDWAECSENPFRWELISTKEFYKRQNIDENTLKEIKGYYKNKKWKLKI